MSQAARILYICHDGQVYGSQQSLLLIVQNLSRLSSHPFQCFVSVARPGPLIEKLQQVAAWVHPLTHRRLQWFKHDKRSVLQKGGDVLVLLLLAPFRVRYLINTLRAHNINVVHTNSIVSLEGALAARWMGLPHVWHIRELFMWDNPKLFPVLGRKLTRWLIDRLSTRVVCISEAVRAQFGPYAEQNPEKYVVIYNAVELPSGKAKSSASKKTGALGEDKHSTGGSDMAQPGKQLFRFGYVGRLSEGKRLHDALEALILLDESLNWELVVVGQFVDADYEERITQLLAHPRLQGRVQMLGYQPDLSNVYPTIDLLIVPSLNEPFGRVVIEAMAYDVPCIGAASGGILEIITDGETGWLYPPKDTEALARRLDTLIRRPELLAPVREKAGRMITERFTIEAQMRKLDTCYQTLFNPQA